MRHILFVILMLACIAAGPFACVPLVEDSSAAALQSGQATMVFGGCNRPMGMGYEVCQLQKGQKLPVLKVGFLNPGEWAVSDCSGGFYKSGATNQPGVVEVDLSGLQSEVDHSGLCWIRLESVEYYPDKDDSSQKHKIAMAGGFLVETLAPGFMPVPSEDMVAWCYQIRRTTKGRTTVTKCK